VSVLFIIDSAEASMAFKLAFDMAYKGDQIHFIFLGKGCNHITSISLIKSLKFATGLHCLKSNLEHISSKNKNQLVNWIDYFGFVELIEKCDTIISWH
jgi:hypothetical protein